MLAAERPFEKDPNFYSQKDLGDYQEKFSGKSDDQVKRDIEGTCEHLKSYEIDDYTQSALYSRDLMNQHEELNTQHTDAGEHGDDELEDTLSGAMERKLAELEAEDEKQVFYEDRAAHRARDLEEIASNSNAQGSSSNTQGPANPSNSRVLSEESFTSAGGLKTVNENSF